MLDYDVNDDHLVLWAATLTAWHFMMHSSEYTAKRKGGKFDLDRVVRVCDVEFFIDGVGTQRYELANEVRITFGKQKCRAGGDVRSHFAAEHKLCVVRTLAMLFLRVRHSDPSQALFAWPNGSMSKGEGVRYADMTRLIKAAAAKGGLDAADYATHSMRKGGAQAYLLAGYSLQELKLQGRWSSLDSVLGYVGQAVPSLTLLKRMQWLVVRGHEDEGVLLNKPARNRDFLKWAAEVEAVKLKQKMGKRCTPDRGGLGSVA